MPVRQYGRSFAHSFTHTHTARQASHLSLMIYCCDVWAPAADVRDGRCENDIGFDSGRWTTTYNNQVNESHFNTQNAFGKVGSSQFILFVKSNSRPAFHIRTNWWSPNGRRHCPYRGHSNERMRTVLEQLIDQSLGITLNSMNALLYMICISYVPYYYALWLIGYVCRYN